jgi:unsaturated rhamnogalacturonyl hydrolase
VITRPLVNVVSCSCSVLIASCSLLLAPCSSPVCADTLVNFADFSSFASRWLSTGCTSANTWCGGVDYDISGTVDGKDMMLFSETWLNSKGPDLLSDDIAALIIHLNPAKSWKYDTAFMVCSLYEKWKRCHNPVYLKWVKDWVDPQVSSAGVITGYNQLDYNLDMTQPGRLLLAMHRHFGTAKYKLAADRLLVQLTNQPTTFDGGFWHKNIYKYQMWLDGVFMAEPFASEYAQIFNASQWFDEAAFQITLIASHTQDTLIYPGDPTRTGLCYHGWADLYGMAHANPVVATPVWADPATGHSPEFWGRAMGWYAMAMVDCLDYLPVDHLQRSNIITILNNLSAGLAAYQDPDDGPDTNNGMWWQVVNKGYPRATYSTNYTESSCTGMFSYAIGKAVEKGYIASDPNYYLAVSRAGLEGLRDYKVSYDAEGFLVLKDTVVVGSLNTTGDYAYYMAQARPDNDVKGVGALMRAALQYEKMTPVTYP